MCWKYEKEYGWCFDHLFFEGPNRSLTAMLEEEYDVNIINKEEFVGRVFSFLSLLHEDGIIKPKERKSV